MKARGALKVSADGAAKSDERARYENVEPKRARQRRRKPEEGTPPVLKVIGNNDRVAGRT